MARFIPLDAGVLGLLCSPPGLPTVVACKTWLAGLVSGGSTIILPDVSDYEVRRELHRLGATAKLRRLDALRSAFRGAEVTPAAWIRASEFWALVRRSGFPAAHPEALDGDAILAAVAATIAGPGDSSTIATTIVGHLIRFPGIDASQWRQIAP